MRSHRGLEAVAEKFIALNPQRPLVVLLDESNAKVGETARKFLLSKLAADKLRSVGADATVGPDFDTVYMP